MTTKVIKEQDAVKEMTENAENFFKYCMSLKKHMENPEVEQFLGTLRLLLNNRKNVKHDDDCLLNQDGWDRLMVLLDEISKHFGAFTKAVKPLHYFLCATESAVRMHLNKGKGSGIIDELQDQVREEIKNMGIDELEKEIEKRFEETQKDIENNDLPEELKNAFKELTSKMHKQFTDVKERKQNNGK